MLHGIARATRCMAQGAAEERKLPQLGLAVDSMPYHIQSPQLQKAALSVIASTTPVSVNKAPA